MGNPIGDKPISDDGLIWFTVLIGVGLPLLFYNIRLKTRVSEEGLALPILSYSPERTHHSFWRY